MTETFVTTDLNLAAYLMMGGCRLEKVSKVEGWGTFRFAHTEELEGRHMGWLNRHPVEMVGKDFLGLIKDLKCTVVELGEGESCGIESRE